MKVLVTGGLGYIGSHTVVALIEAGFDVVIADNLSNSRISVLDALEEITGNRPEFYQIDVSDKESLRELFKQEKDIGGVIHFAAHIFVSESVAKPLNYYRNNLMSLITVLEMMREFQVGNIVFSSSCTVYGDVKNPPVNEEHPLVPAASPYGNTKQIAEEIISDFIHATNGLGAISLRYFNPIGAHESGLIGELALGMSEHLLPNLLMAARKEIPYLKVFGDDYNTPDGSAVRDYIHVMDIARAHVNALLEMKDTDRKEHRFFNLGTGKGYSVLEMTRTFRKVTGIDLQYKIVPRRPGDVEKIWADPSKAERVLGWKAQRSLEEMIFSHWKWDEKLHGEG